MRLGESILMQALLVIRMLRPMEQPRISGDFGGGLSDLYLCWGAPPTRLPEIVGFRPPRLSDLHRKLFLNQGGRRLTSAISGGRGASMKIHLDPFQAVQTMPGFGISTLLGHVVNRQSMRATRRIVFGGQIPEPYQISLWILVFVRYQSWGPPNKIWPAISFGMRCNNCSKWSQPSRKTVQFLLMSGY